MSRLRLAMLFLLSISLGACAPQPAAPVGERGIAHAAVAEAMPTPAPSPSRPGPASPPAKTPAPPPPSPTQPPAAQPPLAAAAGLPESDEKPCAETQGAVSAISVPSDTLNYAIDARLYLPPCYAASDRRYPVLYLIHGLNFKEDQWGNLGAPQAADDLIAAGGIAPLIIVMPRDRLDDRLDRAFVKDLLPYIDTHYRTLADREHRAIGGLSRGAGWAIHIGLEYPDQFSRIGAHSPAVFIGDENNLIQWAWHLPEELLPAVYVDIGEGDSLVHSAAWLDQVLTYSRIKHTYRLRPGAHSEKYWSAHVAEYLSFYAARWRYASRCKFGPGGSETCDP